MTAKAKGGLGRGLGALIPQGPSIAVAAPRGESAPRGAPERSDAGAAAYDAGDLAPVPGARFAEVVVTAITPNPRQPRQVFDEESMDELKSSIEEVGLLADLIAFCRPDWFATNPICSGSLRLVDAGPTVLKPLCEIGP